MAAATELFAITDASKGTRAVSQSIVFATLMKNSIEQIEGVLARGTSLGC